MLADWRSLYLPEPGRRIQGVRRSFWQRLTFDAKVPDEFEFSTDAAWIGQERESKFSFVEQYHPPDYAAEKAK
ncbi:hypothetical protein COLO4_01589, partial [Corchorus olitorius]